MQYHRSHQQSQTILDHDHLNLETCIEFEQERITRSRLFFHGIRFNLNQESLRKIQLAQSCGYHLYLSPQLRTHLRSYALIDGEKRLQSGLTFCTYYQLGESNLALMRSVIGLNGEIFNQIRRDCLEQPNFSREIVSAHYWLIQQLLDQLRFGVLVKLNYLITLICWGCAVLIVIAIIIPLIPLLLDYPWILLAAIPILWLLELGLKGLIGLFLPRIRRWIWHQILLGLLSPKPGSQGFGQGILTWLVS